MTIILVLLVLATTSSSTPVVIETALGRVRGKSDGFSNSFLGIPFAADTSGSNRWRSPQPRSPWGGVFNATRPGEQCIQGESGNGTLHAKDGSFHGTEDCLYINVFTPAVVRKYVPVYLFFHGGMFIHGDATGGGLYDGSSLASNESICVFSASYRLGAFGFMVSTTHGIGGNFGLQDQRFAMNWVHANAAAFGCNASELTIGGESSGAESIAAHLASPLSRGLFRAAISESNLAGMRYRNASEASVFGEAVVRHLSCASAANVSVCLRGRSTKEVASAVLAAESDLRTIIADVSGVWGHLMTIVYFWSPTAYTEDLPLPVQDAFAEGAVAGVPLLTGTNRNEGDAFVPVVPWFDTLKGWEYDLTLRAIFVDGTTRKAVLARPEYRSPGLLSDATHVFSRLLTEYWFECADLRLARSNAAIAETWTYSFVHPLSPAAARAEGLNPLCGTTSTCHAGELQFVFDSAPSGYPPLSAAERQIARSMRRYWGAFIRGETLEGWTPSADQRMMLGDGTRMMTPRPEVCSFWDSIGYRALEFPVRPIIEDLVV